MHQTDVAGVTIFGQRPTNVAEGGERRRRRWIGERAVLPRARQPAQEPRQRQRVGDRAVAGGQGVDGGASQSAGWRPA